MPPGTVDDVRRTTRWVLERARNVTLHQPAVDACAARFAGLCSPEASGPFDDVDGDAAQIAQLVLLADALNFCFWSRQPVTYTWRGRTVERYLAFAARLCEAVRSDARWLEAAFWADLHRSDFAALVPPHGELLLIDERVSVLKEVGRGLLAQAGGQCMNLVDQAEWNAPRLTALLAQQFPSFCDVSSYDGCQVWFLKRAQIAAADLHVAWRRRGWPGLEGVEELTAFADYRLPQVLRHLGIVRCATELERTIESEAELEAGAPAEVELRAAAVQAVEVLAAAVRNRGGRGLPWELDVSLWHAAHDADVRVRHHRTRTVYY